MSDYNPGWVEKIAEGGARDNEVGVGEDVEGGGGGGGFFELGAVRICE